MCVHCVCCVVCVFVCECVVCVVYMLCLIVKVNAHYSRLYMHTVYMCLTNEYTKLFCHQCVHVIVARFLYLKQFEPGDCQVHMKSVTS